jgi:hypothetical protein
MNPIAGTLTPSPVAIGAHRATQSPVFAAITPRRPR